MSRRSTRISVDLHPEAVGMTPTIISITVSDKICRNRRTFRACSRSSRSWHACGCRPAVVRYSMTCSRPVIAQVHGRGHLIGRSKGKSDVSQWTRHLIHRATKVHHGIHHALFVLFVLQYVSILHWTTLRHYNKKKKSLNKQRTWERDPARGVT